MAKVNGAVVRVAKALAEAQAQVQWLGRVFSNIKSREETGKQMGGTCLLWSRYSTYLGSCRVAWTGPDLLSRLDHSADVMERQRYIPGSLFSYSPAFSPAPSRGGR